MNDFHDRLEENYGKALAKLQGPACFAPSAILLREVHKALFDGVFDSAGEFRSNTRPEMGLAGNEISMPRDINRSLSENARSVENLLSEHSPTRKINLISAYHANLMEIEPFREIEGSHFLNRTVALTVLEAQLEHCFNADFIKREVDAQKLQSAVQQLNEFRSPPQLEALVREMAGPRAKVISFDNDPGGPERDRDR